METRLTGINPEYYIYDLSLKKDGTLRWSSSEATTHSLIIRGEYGSLPRLDESLLREAITNPQRLLSEQEFRVSNGLVFLFLRTKELGHAYRLPIVPASYAVCSVAYDRVNEQVSVYQPDASDSDSYVQANATITWRSEQIKSPSGLAKLLKSKQPPAYVLKLSKPQHYLEGSVYYTFEGSNLRFPVTKEMLDQEFIVQAYNGLSEPVIVSDNKGFRVIRA